ncbi:MAG: hypothetical protein MZW92_50615 [Comamonadaceae bacterium]|nr:hypothetical protein [Comamonadaceae bacterium]
MREALAEREVLLAPAPHIVRPLRFVLPHEPHHAPGVDDPRRPVPVRPPRRARCACRRSLHASTSRTTACGAGAQARVPHRLRLLRLPGRRRAAGRAHRHGGARQGRRRCCTRTQFVGGARDERRAGRRELARARRHAARR